MQDHMPDLGLFLDCVVHRVSPEETTRKKRKFKYKSSEDPREAGNSSQEVRGKQVLEGA